MIAWNGFSCKWGPFVIILDKKGVPFWEQVSQFWNSQLTPDSVQLAISPKALPRYIKDKLQATLDPEVAIVPMLSWVEHYGLGQWYDPHVVHGAWAIKQWAGGSIHHTTYKSRIFSLNFDVTF